MNKICNFKNPPGSKFFYYLYNWLPAHPHTNRFGPKTCTANSVRNGEGFFRKIKTKKLKIKKKFRIILITSIIKINNNLR